MERKRFIICYLSFYSFIGLILVLVSVLFLGAKIQLISDSESTKKNEVQ